MCSKRMQTVQFKTVLALDDRVVSLASIHCDDGFHAHGYSSCGTRVLSIFWSHRMIVIIDYDLFSARSI